MLRFGKHHYLLIAGVLLAIVILSGLQFSYQRSKLIQYVRYVPTYDLRLYPPKVLVYSSITSEYLIDHARGIYEQGFDGLILTQLPVGWPGDYPELQKQTMLVRRGNAAAKKAGLITFLKIGIEQGDTPDWRDPAQWQRHMRTLASVSAWARHNGFAGIALDTETYHQEVWNNGITRNAVPDIKNILRKKGTETVQAIMHGFPNAEILVLPEGHLFSYTHRGPHKYALWIYFFDGMLLAHPRQGITLLAERTYTVSSQTKLKDYYYDIQGEIIADNVTEPWYWLSRCSIGLGMWPLGREYDDKRSLMSAADFQEQCNTALQYCPKYVWVYAHGLSWWQTDQGRKYRFNEREAALPRASNYQAYQNTLTKRRDPNLKMFYREIKYNKKYSYLDFLLEKIFIRL
jgi:hypothetical protein